MDELVRLSIGEVDVVNEQTDLALGMTAIGQSLKENGDDLVKLWDLPDNREFIRFAPGLARLVLEQTFAITIGRFDPLRFIALVRGARSHDFMLGQRNPSSFNWIRDVLPDIKPPTSGWWSQEIIGKAIYRAMLHGHLADYIFTSSHELVIDKLTDATAGLHVIPDWLLELLRIETGENIRSILRKRAEESYSILSKGIHFEFFKDNATTPAKEEVVSAINDAMMVSTTVALYSHFSDISLRKISHQEAIRCFLYLANKFHNT